MARPKKNVVVLTESEVEKLEKILRTHTAEARTVQRAKILLYSFRGMNDTAVAEKLDISRQSVSNCICKFRAVGVEAALEDLAGRGRPSTITDDEKAWVINIACQKPTTFGYAQELWTISKLQNHIRTNCEAADYPGLRRIAASKIWTILNDAEIKPHRIRYYLEKRDPNFDQKMEEVLIVYKQIEMQFETNENNGMVTLSYDEKPGIQALANKAPDLLPTMERGYVGRDYEYTRHGTVSLLAGMDLFTGEVIPLVRDSHKSSDFIDFLKILDEKYDKSLKIRIILDNHSAHTSKESMRYLASRPGRFAFVFTPTHGSWLNLIEGFFSKMARVFLRGIRVASKEELIARIYKYMDEVNATPVVHRWKFKMDEITA
ncbi:MAG: IS630 family transposase [Peptococcaceae bacterium]|nr:IS630 family transposase [Peptococcaceae bacterium]